MTARTATDPMAKGLAWGFGGGVAVWIAYFAVQANYLHGASWAKYILPGLGIPAVGAMTIALLATGGQRRWWVGVSIGVALTLPVVLVLLVAVIMVVGAE